MALFQIQQAKGEAEEQAAAAKVAEAEARKSLKDLKQKETRAPIQNEAKNGLKNELGTLAMARTGDPHSATAQFFINAKDNAFLDYPSRDGWGYAVFGKVVQGLDVVQKIARVPTANSAFLKDVPTTPVVIESVKLLPATK